MNAKDLDKIKEDIECKGFDYAFVYYSDYEEIKDEEFHIFRKAFLHARQDLVEFLNAEDI